jgi:hypothetical protein
MLMNGSRKARLGRAGGYVERSGFPSTASKLHARGKRACKVL